MPLLGGGVAVFYHLDAEAGLLRPVASHGLSGGLSGGESKREFWLGEGLVGQCAADRKPATLTGLPPEYLQIASGVGAGAPTRATAWPLVANEGSANGVFEHASFTELSRRAGGAAE